MQQGRPIRGVIPEWNTELNWTTGLNDMRARFVFGFFAAALLLLVLSGLGGCSTVEGMGKDIQRGGEAIERAADRKRAD